MSIRFLDNVSVSANAVFGKRATFGDVFARSLTADNVYYFDGTQYVYLDQKLDGISDSILESLGGLSSNWQQAYFNSGEIINTISPVSGSWTDVYNTVQYLSASWNLGGDVTLEQLGAAPLVHFHTTSQITDFSNAVVSVANQAILDGAGVLYAGLDGNGKIPTNLLPSFVDSIIEFNNVQSFPLIGQSTVIYGARDSGSYYRWTGSRYLLISTGNGTTDAILEGEQNLYFTEARVLSASPVKSVAGKNGNVILTTADIGNLQDILNNKLDANLLLPVSAVAGLESSLENKAPLRHTHVIADVDTLGFRLDNKADLVHFHGIDAIANLRNSLDSKAAVSHTHLTSQITDFNTSVGSVINSAAGNSLATLVNGKIPINQLPNAIERIVEFSTYSILLQYLTPSKNEIYHIIDGDRIFRWTGTTYIEIASSPGSTDGIAEGSNNLYYTTARVLEDSPVKSVATKTGNIVLDYTDIEGLPFLLNSKASTIHFHTINDVSGLSGILDLKASTSHFHIIDEIPGLTAALSGKAAAGHIHNISEIQNLSFTLDSKAAAIHGHAISEITGLQNSLDSKAAASHTHTAANISDLNSVINATVGNLIGTNVVSYDTDTGKIRETDLPEFVAEVYSTVRNTSGSFAPKNSPTFTGTPQAPTPNLSDASQAITNTSWVRNYVNSVLTNTGARLSAVDIADFTEAVLNIAPVISVAGRVGNVSLSASDIISLNETITAIAAVQSVAGRIGAIQLSSVDILDFNSAVDGLYPTSLRSLTAGRVDGDLLITGQLSALGSVIINNTVLTTSSSALSVVNVGPGPALYIQQAAGSGNIASFRDMDGVDALFIGNARNPNGSTPSGVVGILTNNPTDTLSVAGTIGSTGNINAGGDVVATGRLRGDGSAITNLGSTITTAAWSSPLLTGNARSTEPSQFDVSNKIATTNWVDSNLKLNEAYNYAIAIANTPVYYTTTIGDGLTSRFLINHNLQTKNVIVQVQDLDGNYVIPSIQATSNNQSVISFNLTPTLTSYNVIAYAVGTLPGYSGVNPYRAQKYSTLIGDAVNSVYTISHNLNSTEVVAQVYDTSTNTVVNPTIQFINANQVTVTFGSMAALNSYRLIVLA